MNPTVHYKINMTDKYIKKVWQTVHSGNSTTFYRCQNIVCHKVYVYFLYKRWYYKTEYGNTLREYNIMRKTLAAIALGMMLLGAGAVRRQRY